ncbi:hypothetical protein OESDEN_15641 [Oesophagostomum dentatum]|uniref:Uncharacterized protein n=1 Tax=Oesophagostomum dentatum TaxID=61180 RepID=A0A0B1SH72_OESDE|nr:hypothetical protein OESDEN_15641 [Oesophagostomum dentatum]
MEHRYSKRQRIDDDGPIDHDLMAALGFGKNRHKTTAEPAERAPRSSIDHEVSRTEHVTTVGDMSYDEAI